MRRILSIVIPKFGLLLSIIALWIGILILFPLWPGQVKAQNKPSEINATQQALADHITETHEHLLDVDRRLDALEKAEMERAVELGRIETATELIRDFMIAILTALFGLIVERVQDRVTREQ